MILGVFSCIFIGMVMVLGIFVTYPFNLVIWAMFGTLLVLAVISLCHKRKSDRQGKKF